MKALSLWQPWASLMAVGLKRNETRGRATYVRGDVAICAAARKPRLDEISFELQLIIIENANLFLPKNTPFTIETILANLPLGYMVSINELYASVRIEFEYNKPSSRMELACGNYDFGRHIWKTKNLRQLKEPVPVIGKQGFFNLPAYVEAKVKAQL